MAQDRDSQVRQRAHQIWLDQGSPDGLAEQHWEQAEAEFDADEASATITPASAVKPEAAAEVEPAAAAEAPAVKKPGRRKVSAKTAPDIGAAPEFDAPAEPPLAPDVIAVTDVGAASPKKPGRRKVKPIPTDR